MGLVSAALAKSCDPIVQTLDVGFNNRGIGNPCIHSSGLVVNETRTIGHFGFHRLHVGVRDIGDRLQALRFNGIAKTHQNSIEQNLLYRTLPSLTETLVNPFRLLLVSGAVSLA